MIHARRQESGISRSRASRSDRLYRVSCLFVHFLAPFPPLSHRHLTVPFALFFSQLLPLSLLCFFMLGQRRRTENYRRYLDRTRYRFFSASSLHTRAKSDAQTDNQRRENGGPFKLRQAWLTRRVLSFRLFYFLRYGELPVSHLQRNTRGIVIDTRVNFLSIFEG